MEAMQKTRPNGVIQLRTENKSNINIQGLVLFLEDVGKTGFASHTKHIVEVTSTDLLHSLEITCNLEF